jgi:hypothetical protein
MPSFIDPLPYALSGVIVRESGRSSKHSVGIVPVESDEERPERGALN